MAKLKSQIGLVLSSKNTKKEEEEEEEEEKWVQYYSSSHEILLVGEGDFSFSTCLAQSFGSASNIVATSLDSYDNVIRKYKKAKLNFSILEKLGASHLHGVDATQIKFHCNLQMRKFDRIIFNFPHAGFHRKENDIRLIRSHRRLLDGFFKNASGMLRPYGEVHINHKTAAPYSKWNLEELANRNSLGLIECVTFNQEDYPGYKNKRGSGARCDDNFYLGKCCTFKFNLDPTPTVTGSMKKFNTPLEPPKASHFVLQPQPNSFEFRDSPLNFIRFTNDNPRFNMSCIEGADISCGKSHENFQAPICVSQHQDYLQYRHPPPNFSPPEAFGLGYERYMAREPGRSPRGYINTFERRYEFFIGRQELRRQVSPEHRLGSDSRSGTFW